MSTCSVRISNLAFSSINAGRGAVIDEAGSARRLNSGHGHTGDRVGISHLAFRADEYGWLQIYGSGMIGVNANTSRNVHLYTSSGGRFGEVIVNQKRVANIYLTETHGPINGPAPAIWFYPRFL